MNSKQAKRARAEAYAEAKRQDLWNKGKASLFSKWWRRILNLFPRFRKRYENAIGRWYKATIKRWSRESYAYIHDRDGRRYLVYREEFDRWMKSKQIGGAA